MHWINTGQITVQTHTHLLRVRLRWWSLTHCPRSKGFPCDGEPTDEVQKKKERQGCQTGTKSLSTSLPPVFFASFSPSLSPHLGSPLLFLASEVRSASLSAQRRWQRPSFSFITTLSLSISKTVHPCPLDGCPLLPLRRPFSAYTSIHLPPQTPPLLSVCLPARGENRAFF